MHWPEQLIIVRHGQSAGNVARDAAHEAAHDRIALTSRDADVPLSDLGTAQARALGLWFCEQPAEHRPQILLSSPYLRAFQTAELFREAGGTDRQEPICFDERLREKEFGILDGLTTPGVANIFPDQAEFRRLLGKFYHRPPGGESWCDVILRLRSVLDTISLHYAGKRVMIFTHQVVVLCMRYIIESLDEQRILAIDREGDVANCAITDYLFDPSAGRDGGLKLQRYNVTAPMQNHATPVTSEPDAITGRRG
ncbi:broad specificity phosphatase PhoE [Sphingobium sp. B1D7B]|uniref:histidine phosphatase family protein n=1 Tax=unclassified Sphingobium TaxID=2611147 RepID=UPI002225686E|nr:MULTISPECIES: histidine phosphatase family protein [unclassified Sphingobium]MCW2351344.1 broad specificity phosphatase PhoE [Sphingobium sp. B12D2B]MCW2393023.1 broad specificity phosphatase PhoE [Sphingobium sp. B11D3A]MCW2404826.1 broad specificity phosphatase PhoE [Sphingobium sp. B1D7B]